MPQGHWSPEKAVDLSLGRRRLALIVRTALGVIFGLSLTAMACVLLFGVGPGLFLFFVGIGVGGGAAVAAVRFCVDETIPELSTDDPDLLAVLLPAILAATAVVMWVLSALTISGVLSA